ncbi:hypothetical protein ES703_122930 [subsurface metagenome]
MAAAPAQSQGFTLIELVVVISIIGVLAALLFPVFSRVREKARQTRCQHQMMQLVTELNQYHRNNGHYPPRPYYDTDDARYKGGFSALYPDYVTDRDLFICPDDRAALQNLGDCRDRIYCSYNGIADWDDDNSDGNIWDLKYVLYNYYGYTYQFMLGPSAPDDPDRLDEIPAGNGYSSGYDTGESSCILPGYAGMPGWMDVLVAHGEMSPNGIPDWLDAAGLTWRHFPALRNNNPPDTTIVTHCPNHRRYGELDLIVRVTGETDKVNPFQLGDPTETGVGVNPVAGWVHQNF